MNPSTSSSGTSSQQARSPIGTTAKTGDTCPESGTWRVENSATGRSGSGQKNEGAHGPSAQQGDRNTSGSDQGRNQQTGSDYGRDQHSDRQATGNTHASSGQKDEGTRNQGDEGHQTDRNAGSGPDTVHVKKGDKMPQYKKESTKWVLESYDN